MTSLLLNLSNFSISIEIDALIIYNLLFANLVKSVKYLAAEEKLITGLQQNQQSMWINPIGGSVFPDDQSDSRKAVRSLKAANSNCAQFKGWN